jgi:amino acid permease
MRTINWAIVFTIVALILLFALGVAYGIAITNMPPQPRSAARVIAGGNA